MRGMREKREKGEVCRAEKAGDGRQGHGGVYICELPSSPRRVEPGEFIDRLLRGPPRTSSSCLGLWPSVRVVLAVSTVTAGGDP